jgi:tetratricopeptide (TPR) repeat protein
MSGILQGTPPTESDSPLQPRGDSRAVWLACCALVLGVVIVFGRAVNCGFIICDDSCYVTDNPNVNTGLSWENVRWAFTAIHSSNWHPLTWLSHMFDVQCYGLWPGGHHLTNIAIHAASAVLLFLALRQMTGAFWRSVLVAGMFAIHPLRVESVVWVAERKDVLSGLCWMLTLLLYVRYVRQPGGGRRSAVVAIFALGLMAKSMLVTLPGVLLLLDFWPLGRWRPKRFAPEPTAASQGIGQESFKKLLWEKMPLVLLAILVSVVVAAGQRSAGAMSKIGCLWKMIWPVDLAILYPHPAAIHPDAIPSFLWQGALAAVGLTAVTAWVLCNLRRRPYLAVGWFWYLGALLPVIGVVQIGNHALADRYTYLPMIGIFIMIVWYAADLASQSRAMRVALSTAAACLLVAWMAVTANQISYWRDAFAVAQHAIDVTEDNYFAHCLLGMAYHRNGQDEQALAEYKKAVAIAPQCAQANLLLGTYWRNHRQYDKAERCLQAAIDIDPSVVMYRDLLNALHAEEKLFNEAVSELRRCAKLHPHDPRGCGELADLLCKHGNTAREAGELRRFLASNADDPALAAKIEQFLRLQETTEQREPASTQR